MFLIACIQISNQSINLNVFLGLNMKFNCPQMKLSSVNLYLQYLTTQVKNELSQFNFVVNDENAKR